MITVTPQAAARTTGRLLLGDCVEVLPRFPEECVDFVLTDPPYLVNFRDRQGRTLQGDADHRWVGPAFGQIHRAMKPDSLCLSFFGWTHVETFIEAWKRAGLRPVGHIVFVKPYASGANFVARRHEQAMLLAKGRPTLPVSAPADVMPWGRYTGNKLHPTQKPVDLLRRLIRAFTRLGDIVLDPFCGSASTLVAAELEGRRAVGIEKDPAVYRVARQRLGY